MATKQYDPAIVASLTTGTMLVEPFSLMHELAEHVMGCPIWTHQFTTGSMGRLPEIKAKLLAMFPEMPTTVEPLGWEATRDAVREHYGPEVDVRGAD